MYDSLFYPKVLYYISLYKLGCHHTGDAGALCFQLRILGGALSLHRKLAPPDVQPLHQHLEELYTKMKQGIKESVRTYSLLVNVCVGVCILICSCLLFMANE